jgi:hypothetical protein
LYPDVLLSQVLIAATQPAEVVQAQRWLDNPANRALTGPALEQALAPLPWDPAVKSLVPFPEVLALLGNHLDWTQQLAWAAQTQQPDVLNSIQRLRMQAQQAGTLTSSANYVVRDEPGPSGTAIVIEPAQPNMVVVPVYDPARVYGAWLYPAYPPVVYAPPPTISLPVFGLAFGAGVLVAGGLWALSRPDWGHRRIDVDAHRWQAIGHDRPPPAWTGGAFGGRAPMAPAVLRPEFVGHPGGAALGFGPHMAGAPVPGGAGHPQPHEVPGPGFAPRPEPTRGREAGEMPHPQPPRGPQPSFAREPAFRPAYAAHPGPGPGRPEAARPEPRPGPSAQGRPEPHQGRPAEGRPEPHQGHNG